MARSKFFSLFGRPDALTPDISAAAPVAAVVPDAAAEIATLTAQLEAAQTELVNAQARLAEQTATAIETIAAASAAIETLTAASAAITIERDDARAALAADREAITQQIRQQEMATLAASQGIPAAEIVPAVASGSTSREEKDAQMKVVIEEMNNNFNPVERGKLAAKLAALRQ